MFGHFIFVFAPPGSISSRLSRDTVISIVLPITPNVLLVLNEMLNKVAEDIVTGESHSLTSIISLRSRYLEHYELSGLHEVRFGGGKSKPPAGPFRLAFSSPLNPH